MTTPLTLIDAEADGAAREIPASIVGESIRIAPADLEAALGWQLKPEGLCRGEVCVPVRDRTGLEWPEGIDLAAFAGALGRPLAAEPGESVASLGAASADRAAALASLEAPDFTLPDLAGRLHTLSDHRGKKVLLIAYASW